MNYLLMGDWGGIVMSEVVTEEDFVMADAGLLTIIDMDTKTEFYEDEWIPLKKRM